MQYSELFDETDTFDYDQWNQDQFLASIGMTQEELDEAIYEQNNYDESEHDIDHTYDLDDITVNGLFLSIDDSTISSKAAHEDPTLIELLTKLRYPQYKDFAFDIKKKEKIVKPRRYDHLSDISFTFA